jgi:hypothetical protein
MGQSQLHHIETYPGVQEQRIDLPILLHGARRTG